MEYKFSALSSNKTDRYEVVVFEIAGQIGITCDCPATVLCKHTTALITGNPDSIFPPDLNDTKELQLAISAIKLNGISEKYNALNAELDELKKEFKKREKKIKNQMYNLGIPKI
ncbi:TPA: hypothetical protein ACYRSE_000112 [Klebsiella michiganensis]|uniref:hypothetical protein n=1 Tax=Klebsiella/Raoultella group TaxID=2890311 RepID=UPI000D0B3DE1|nr:MULTISPECIES: hypothetical protein [Klebsiella/Raoultella group]HBZ8006164.1 hypothetical protein [Klebsiella variicola subsp. variicola]PSI99127.1 hypothetical protein C6400_15555 [Klebsiella michiganensis]WJV38095.1 hypothetical protein QVN03_22375 [Raoultella terrigena]HBK4615510.1 hypothetical protein [Klebsiella michiganensis]HBM3162500.1 hypothetical protein [Klebsiella michiganensis]